MSKQSLLEKYHQLEKLEFALAISNTIGDKERTAELIDQISSTVKWRESLIYMSNSGVQNFIEIGPGKVLSGMVKRTISNVNCFSINSIADIKNLNDKFKR